MIIFYVNCINQSTNYSVVFIINISIQMFVTRSKSQKLHFSVYCNRTYRAIHSIIQGSMSLGQ